ncbi:hypothetical protein PR048_001609 [Dryococelus australis]|uniref:Uncharacterized protein n=1 Tax=Dryococelus australis TaxID=614101 RepID=A0ABQ9IHT6_9NEOP|nr:hypothetical protein PR048_001609 [Dryococelus australis]
MEEGITEEDTEEEGGDIKDQGPIGINGMEGILMTEQVVRPKGRTSSRQTREEVACLTLHFHSTLSSRGGMDPHLDHSILEIIPRNKRTIDQTLTGQCSTQFDSIKISQLPSVNNECVSKGEVQCEIQQLVKARMFSAVEKRKGKF